MDYYNEYYADVNNLIRHINKYYPDWKEHDDFEYYFYRPINNIKCPAAVILRDACRMHLNNNSKKMSLCSNDGVDTMLDEFSKRVDRALNNMFIGGTRKQSKDKMNKQKSKKSRKVKNPKKKSKYSRKAK